MSPINDIHIHDVNVPQVHSYKIPHTNIPVHQVPVTLQIGFPIVDMPGCVKMHKDNKDHISRLPFDKDLVNQDPKGSTVLCPHGEYPSYDAIDYQPENLVVTRETPPPPIAPPPEIETPELPDTGGLAPEEEIECPAPNQPRVGDLTQAGDERVIGHELQGTTCVVLYEDTTPVEKFLPSTNQISTTAAIAVVATASAAATPLLLRVIKPIIKKATDFVKKKLGKEVYKPTRSDIATDKYREKRGLKPIKRK
tara:strand:- start:252 stop:1007 length:756 start_codon:yes stop_codon:yes gene_type:complete